VFFRESDPVIHHETKNPSEEIQLIQPFATFEEADRWIMKNGGTVADEEEDNRGRPVSLPLYIVETATMIVQWVLNQHIFMQSQRGSFPSIHLHRLDIRCH